MLNSEKSSNGASGVLKLTPPTRVGKTVGSWTKVKLSDGEWIEVIDLTPAIAAEMETHNTGNRARSESTVDTYASDMLAGTWKLQNDNIVFDTSGRLINGQHRIHAVMKSGVTIRVGVQYNADPTTQKVMDIGRARTLGGRLSIEGKAHALYRAAWVRTIYELTDGHGKMPVHSQDAILKRWSKSIDWAAENMPTLTALKRAPIVGAIVMAHRVDTARVGEFMALYRDGENLRKGSPVFTLREYALARLSEVRQNRRDISLKTLRAIEVFIQGGRLSKLEPTESGLNFVCDRLNIKRGA